MSQARLPRTEPSTELITAHKANHRAAHVAGRAVGIFAKVRSRREPPELCTGSTFSCAAAHGGPPQHITEAWQVETWKNLSMQPVEQSHLKGSATSPVISAQLFRPPCPAPEVAQQRIPPPMNL